MNDVTPRDAGKVAEQLRSLIEGGGRAADLAAARIAAQAQPAPATAKGWDDLTLPEKVEELRRDVVKVMAAVEAGASEKRRTRGAANRAGAR